MPKYVVVVLAILATGCASTYTKDTLTSPSVQLQSGVIVAIGTPEDGSYGGEPYPESGQATALAVRAAFSRHASEAVVLPGCRILSCLRDAAPRAAYFVVPEILHWEDRATEWSGKKDKLEVKLSVYGSQSDSPLASTIISGKSKWMTFGGDHPQDLLPEPINTYVETLF